MSTMNPEEVSGSVSRLLTSLAQGHQSGFQSKAGLPVLGRSTGISYSFNDALWARVHDSHK